MIESGFAAIKAYYALTWPFMVLSVPFIVAGVVIKLWRSYKRGTNV